MYEADWAIPLGRAIAGIVALHVLVILAWWQFMRSGENKEDESFDSGLV